MKFKYTVGPVGDINSWMQSTMLIVFCVFFQVWEQLLELQATHSGRGRLVKYLDCVSIHAIYTVHYELEAPSLANNGGFKIIRNLYILDSTKR